MGLLVAFFEYVSLLIVLVFVSVASPPLILRGPFADFAFVYFPVLWIDWRRAFFIFWGR